MNQMLKIGQTVRAVSTGTSCRVEQFLGGGGQGEVYRAVLIVESPTGAQSNSALALKWYFPAQATAAQRAALAELIRKGAPNGRFLWPIDLAEAPGARGFGYLMPLRDPRYRGIVDLMKRRIEPSFRALAGAGLGLAQAFLDLHSQGLCYRDISFGNVFFDPQSGDVLVGDNDNVAVDRAAQGAVLGTPRFMAPEIVRGEALPSTQSDLFSLAVLLFYMLMVHHPLEGAREAAIHALDLPAMNKLYGAEPLFIYDPGDESNRPLPGYHDNALIYWRLYPAFLRELFTRAFTAGLRDPQSRVRESEWRAAMARLRDAILYCGACGAENFYDAEALRAADGAPGACWSCARALVLPPRIRIGRHVVMLNHDTQLFPHHVDDQRLYDFSQPVAVMAQHPVRKHLWGLKNLSGVKWDVTLPDGSLKEVKPDQSAPLALGAKIQFGKAEGEIRI
ncbi:MAG: serine/threonine protein kinase [Chloroflexi bacterium]|nr:serine/threonine protein kinase [Chloroflexota bacterium]